MMIPNGKTANNKVAPVILNEGNISAGVEPGLTNHADALEEEIKRSKGKIRKPRGINSIGSGTKVKVGFTRWKKAALDGIHKSKNEGQKRTFKDKLKVPGDKISHRMNAAQLSDLEDLVDGDGANKHKGNGIANGANGTSISSSSRALLYYFAKLSANANTNEVIDLEFVETLIKTGASVSVTDRHGQTVMHETARQWEVAVAKFLIKRGASINQADRFGRTPLHVAAAVDYPDMVRFLVENGADVHARTLGELQTPIHYAARNDAATSLKMLLRCGANMDDRDYKERTPLQVAAELDRSETAKLLVKQGADAGVMDDSGMTALVMMISKMPVVAKEALNQFYSYDRANRKQYFYLNYLEPVIPKCINSGWPQTALEVVVLHKQFDLIMHPVFQRLLKIKWQRFGKRGAWFQAISSLIYVILWTVIGITKADKPSEYYQPISEKWWRIGLYVFAVLMTFNEIRREISDILFSKKEHRLWMKWRETELQRDLKYCHPRWPGERIYLMQEIDFLHQQEPSYFNDAWNVFDWLTYCMVMASLVTHGVSVLIDHMLVHNAHINIMSATLICIWIRLLKTFRAFTALGPFVVMLGHLIYDILKFFFLFVVFYIPYAASFWMVFSSHNISGYSTIADLLFSMFRMTVVDDYNYDELSKAEPIMSKILCGTYLAFSAIICLNLFIALMSDTFQRVYDNVKANAAMQQANTILSLENNLSVTKKKKFANFIHTRCSPDELYYDDDVLDDDEGDLKRMTHQIKEELEEMHSKMDAQGSKKRAGVDGVKSDVTRDELDALRGDLGRVEQQQRAMTAQFHTQIGELKEMLRDVIVKLNKPRKKRHVQTSFEEPGVGEHGHLQTLQEK